MTVGLRVPGLPGGDNRMILWLWAY